MTRNSSWPVTLEHFFYIGFNQFSSSKDRDGPEIHYLQLDNQGKDR